MHVQFTLTFSHTCKTNARKMHLRASQITFYMAFKFFRIKKKIIHARLLNKFYDSVNL